MLVRHGNIEYNNIQRFAGFIDLELTEEGLKQVEKLRDRLEKEAIDAIYSSDLKRAFMTAEVIASRHKVEIVSCYELREVNYGDVDGFTFEEIKQRYPKLAEEIADFSPELSFPSGDSLKGFIDRTLTFLDRLKEHSQEQTVLIVSHGGAIRALLCDLLGIGQKYWQTFRLDNASISIIDTYPKRAILSLLNDTSHLKGNPQGV